jgi:predicted nucleotidyltransferase
VTEEELRALPLTIDLMTSAQILGISRNEAYILARSNTYPVPLYRVGSRYRVAKAHLLEVLGMSTPSE